MYEQLHEIASRAEHQQGLEKALEVSRHLSEITRPKLFARLRQQLGFRIGRLGPPVPT